MTAAGVRTRLMGLALLSVLAGCVEINRAPVRVYSTAPNHDIHLPGWVRVDWIPLPTGSLSFRYTETTELPKPPLGDTVLEIQLHTSPDYRSSGGFFAASTLRYRIVSAVSPLDTAETLPMDIILFRRSPDGGWVERDRWTLYWQEDEHGRRDFTLFIPDTLAGPEPAVAWSVRRSFRGSQYFLPDSPGLLIRDPAAFSAKLYGTSDP